MIETVPDQDPVIAIGLLTAHDLDLLGAGFRRAYPIADDPAFDDLIRAIDAADRKRQEKGRPPGKG